MKLELGDGERSVKKGETLYVFDPLMRNATPFLFDRLNDDGWVRCRDENNRSNTLTTGFQPYYCHVSTEFFWDPDACLDAQIIRLLKNRTDFKGIVAKEVDKHSPIG